MISLFFALLISLNSFADDVGQMMGDQGTLTDFEKSLEQYEGTSANVSGTGSNEVESLKTFGPSGMIPGIQPEQIPEENPLDPGQGILGTDENLESVRTYSKDEVLRSVTNRSESIFSVSYIKDNYDYSDRSNIFTKTYENSTGSVKAGMLLVSIEKYIFKKGIEGTWGFGGGFGFNSGKGQFIDGSSSEAEFKLYTIPLDLVFGAYIPLGNFAKLALRGGPSAMGLYQNRNDFENKAKGKEKRQIGFGYFGEAKFQLSLTNIFRSAAFHLYSDYQISQAFFDIKIRLQDYGNFQDEDLAISGQSIGIGFTFEYL